MKKILGLILILLSVAIVGFLSYQFIPQAKATQQVDNCDHSCPVVHFEWTTKEYQACPEGYSIRLGHQNQCRKNTSPFTIIDRPFINIPHTADVAYIKSEDPNKCHRPNDEVLDDEYGLDHDARSTFKDTHPEFLDSIDIAPQGYYLTEGACYPKIQVCGDESAINYGGEDGKFDSEKEISKNLEEIFNVFEESFSDFGFRGLKFVIADANPKQAVLITDGTEIKVNPNAMEGIEEAVPDVTYEDIGG